MSPNVRLQVRAARGASLCKPLGVRPGNLLTYLIRGLAQDCSRRRKCVLIDSIESFIGPARVEPACRLNEHPYSKGQEHKERKLHAQKPTKKEAHCSNHNARNEQLQTAGYYEEVTAR